MNKKRGKHFEGLDQSAFDSIKSWGMNSIRLGIFWDGLEPEPGKIDSLYLKQLDSLILRAEKAGLYVLLDMHQDLYSEKYGGDGAPDWACLDEGKPNTIIGGSWDDAYFTSPAIQTAFDNFWKNKKVSDGMGVQDHLINVWRTVAERYAESKTVIGFNLMNEPFIGSAINQVLEAYFKKILSINEEHALLDISTEEELLELWLSSDGRAQVMQLLENKEWYKQVMDASEPIYKEFEEKHLQSFYDKAYQEIRSVNSRHLLFLEPSVSANIGVKSFLKNNFGNRLVYSPHTYDIVTDTDHQASFSKDRLELILNRHHEKNNSLNVPLVMGEWGAFYGADSSVIEQAEYLLDYMKAIDSGHFYWSFEKDLNQRAYFNTLINY